jgi:3-(3-hydroxy-phenyl)propionate hydroxylase
MLNTYRYPSFEYRRSAEQASAQTLCHPVVIIGAGPVGLSLALDCAARGLKVVVLDDNNTVSVGSRAVCYAKRTLEILDRLGVGQPLCDKGVSWNIGRTFLQEDEVYQFNLVPEPGHKRPGMINLQQYYLEEALVTRALELGVDIRWKCKAVGVSNKADHAVVRIASPEGEFSIEADWLVVADGARSPIRRMLGLDMEGQVFKDRFLIADVVMKADFPAERRLWFDPPFHRGQSVLLHKQADNVWRIDFQLGWDADPEEETKPERVLPRIQAMLGDERPFTLEWVSIYTFQCRRMNKFKHQRLLFAGDAAHQVSPFGARGANSGLQDADGLMWKLALVMKGLAPESLLESYNDERVYAADENILNSTRSTDFITPKSPTSVLFRQAALELARHHPFARKLVNSGRLSVPSFITHSVLNTPDVDAFAGDMLPGAPMDDAPITCNGHNGWLLDQLGHRFQCLVYVDDVAQLDAHTLHELQTLVQDAVAVQPIVVSRQAGAIEGVSVLVDAQGLFAKRYDAQPGSAWLVRPDQHVVARWRGIHRDAIAVARDRATCNA